MKIIISTKNETSSAVAKFKERIESASIESKNMEWAFPNEQRERCKTYKIQTSRGALLIAIPTKKWNGRQAHLFALNYQGGALAPDVEINIPNTLNRKVSGAYVKNGKEILICHRGGFTAYRGKIPIEVIHSYFGKWMYDIQDGDRDSRMIGVASLSSRSMAEEIAVFVEAVSEMKRQFKADGISSEETLERNVSAWRDTREYEGEKHSGSPDSESYEYLHGPLCNALSRQLKKYIPETSKVTVRSNTNIDVALVNTASDKALIIFEVKTSASLSSQLYSAVGQLAYYKHIYGTSDTETYLVLPEEARNDFKCGKFLSGIGINIIFGEQESFKTETGDSLKKLVDRYI